MASRRKLIRNRFREVLLGKTDAGQNVFSNRASATWSEELPLIAVYSRAEGVENTGTAPLEFKRTIEMAVEIIAQGSEEPGAALSAEDILDDVAEQVEKALFRDETLGEIDSPLKAGKKISCVDSLKLKTIEFDFQGEGAKPVGSAIMLFDAVYYEMSPVALEEEDGSGVLETVHADWTSGKGEDPPANPEDFGIADHLAIPS